MPLVLWAFLGPPDGSSDQSPETEAQLLDGYVRRYNAAAVIVCAEQSHIGVQPDYPAIAQQVSERFAATFARLQPGLPRCVQFLAAPSRASGQVVTTSTFAFDYAAWFRHGFVPKPECYWGTMGGGSPDYEPLHTVRYLGQPPRDRRPTLVPYCVKPTVAASGYGPNHTPAEYIANLTAAGTVGLDVYPLEQMQPGEWGRWAAAVTAGVAR